MRAGKAEAKTRAWRTPGRASFLTTGIPLTKEVDGIRLASALAHDALDFVLRKFLPCRPCKKGRAATRRHLRLSRRWGKGGRPTSRA